MSIEQHTKRLAILGLGLIGGSVARAARQRGLSTEIVAYDTNRSALAYASEQGIIDRVADSPAEAVRGATLVMLATPVGAIVPVLQAARDGLASGTVVTDVGSVKQSIVTLAEHSMPEAVHFVGGHPIAGREHAGVQAAVADLFQGRRVILTPTARAPEAAIRVVRNFWQACGGLVETMDPAEHDSILAATSHLPHLVAYTVVNTLADIDQELSCDLFRYAASGFSDFTRIASSDPVMWRDVCLANPDAILSALTRFQEHLATLSGLVRTGDHAALERLFARSKTTRDRVLGSQDKA